MASIPQYSGGSALADLLRGLSDGYQVGESMRLQRAQEQLAKSREARYADEAAAQEREREEAARRQRALDAVSGITSAAEVDTSERVTTRDNSDVRRGLGDASRALQSLPGWVLNGQMLGAQAPRIADATTERFRVVGDTALDRTRTDPALQSLLRGEHTRKEQDAAARALESLIPGAGALVRGGVSPTAAFSAMTERERAALRSLTEREQQAQTRAGLEEAARRFNVDPTGLDDESLRDMVDAARAARYRRPAGGGGGGTSPTSKLTALNNVVSNAESDLARVDRIYAKRPEDLVSPYTGNARPGQEGRLNAWKADSASRTDAAQDAVAQARADYQTAIETGEVPKRGTQVRSGFFDTQPSAARAAEAKLAAELNQFVVEVKASALPPEEQERRILQANERFNAEVLRSRGAK
ncbi:MAG: hypothetical protein SFU84_03275 [Gemmatimonadales bacterium]|nr:hypothetical protein [Gemmatimonadales bacterium]